MWDSEHIYMPGSNVTKDDINHCWSWAKRRTWYSSRHPIPHVIDHVCSSTQKLIRFNLSYLVGTYLGNCCCIVWVSLCSQDICRRGIGVWQAVGLQKLFSWKGLIQLEAEELQNPRRVVLGLSFSKQSFGSFTVTNVQRGKIGGVTYISSSLLEKEKKKTKKKEKERQRTLSQCIWSRRRNPSGSVLVWHLVWSCLWQGDRSTFPPCCDMEDKGWGYF